MMLLTCYYHSNCDTNTKQPLNNCPHTCIQYQTTGLGCFGSVNECAASTSTGFRSGAGKCDREPLALALEPALALAPTPVSVVVLLALEPTQRFGTYRACCQCEGEPVDNTTATKCAIPYTDFKFHMSQCTMQYNCMHAAPSFTVDSVDPYRLLRDNRIGYSVLPHWKPHRQIVAAGVFQRCLRCMHNNTRTRAE